MIRRANASEAERANVIEMARAGNRNCEISRALRIHPVTVSRIITSAAARPKRTAKPAATKKPREFEKIPRYSWDRTSENEDRVCDW